MPNCSRDNSASRSRLATDRIGTARDQVFPDYGVLQLETRGWGIRSRSCTRAHATIYAESNRTCGALFFILLLTAHHLPPRRGITNRSKPREIASESSNVSLSFFSFSTIDRACVFYAALSVRG